METFLSQPVVAYVAFVLATSLALIEASLPTDGVAGVAAAVFAVIGVASVVVGGLVVWPLAVACLGAVAWLTLLIRRRRNVGADVAAAVVFAVGSLAFALVGGFDVFVAVVAVVASVALAIGFVPLHRAALRLHESREDVGMTSFLGRTVEVRFWEETSGTVIVDGAFWSADGPAGLVPGDEVEVQWFEGMRLHVSDAIGKNQPAVDRQESAGEPVQSPD
jgi:membrane protein implicated in regulation of membrane protease activity